jgi:hypothetical protein
MKNAVFWDVTKCDSCKNRLFGGMFRLHHQGDKNQLARNNVSNNWKPKHAALEVHHSGLAHLSIRAKILNSRKQIILIKFQTSITSCVWVNTGRVWIDNPTYYIITDDNYSKMWVHR